MDVILQYVLILLGIAFVLLLIWALIPKKFKKIADIIEHIIDSITSGFP